jgi:hypothetical protein
VETNQSNFRIFPMDICLSPPHGTKLTAFADVKYRCCQMLHGLVSTHPIFCLELKSSLNIATWGQCYKNTMVNYRGNFNPTFSRVKMTLKNDIGLKILLPF